MDLLDQLVVHCPHVVSFLPVRKSNLPTMVQSTMILVSNISHKLWNSSLTNYGILSLSFSLSISCWYFVFFVVKDCGRSSEKISRIVGGNDASFGQFPWLVSFSSPSLFQFRFPSLLSSSLSLLLLLSFSLSLFLSLSLSLLVFMSLFVY